MSKLVFELFFIVALSICGISDYTTNCRSYAALVGAYRTYTSTPTEKCTTTLRALIAISGKGTGVDIDAIIMQTSTASKSPRT